MIPIETHYKTKGEKKENRVKKETAVPWQKRKKGQKKDLGYNGCHPLIILVHLSA